MAQRGIREYDAKQMLARYWKDYVGKDFTFEGKAALVAPETDLDKLVKEKKWLKKEKLVVKPDQLFGKRGKHGLIALNKTFPEAKKWVKERRNKETKVGKVTGNLTHFIIEPFTPHKREYYIAIKGNREGDTIYFSNHGGVDIESVWKTVAEIHVDVGQDVGKVNVEAKLPKDTSKKHKKIIADFIRGLFRFYSDLGYAYLEINPFVIIDNKKIVPLDLVARIDDTSAFENAGKWGALDFPAPFGRKKSKEELYVKSLDEKSGASLKLTILNPQGRVWSMVAGGGASVVYTDTIVDLGFRDELANYGEYSGNPDTDLTYEYAKTILDLMTREKDPKGRPKYLLVGGGIANFTDVAKTFRGIIMALREYRKKLIANKVKIFVRRGGPNYQEGLKQMRKVGEELGIPIEVYGPETHMTRIVPMALAKGGRK
ncbi:MAG: ATP citrate lyase citrate-binding domain-containing protein [Chloroflexota bacterium]|nr:ATP citrate lyase citrate-binding domain-containing protein [Chloroflexota bacterium]